MSPASPIGALRARVRLQSPARTPDDLGGAALGWSEEGAVWAAIAPRGARAGAAADARVSTATYAIEIRARAGVRPGWRVVWGARAFAIEGVLDAPSARLTLLCEEAS